MIRRREKESRIFVAFTFTIAIIFVASYFYISNTIILGQNEIASLGTAQDTNSDEAKKRKAMLTEALNALLNAKKVNLVTLEPKTDMFMENPLLTALEAKNHDALPYSPPPQYFYGHLLLGQTQVTGKNKKIAVQEFRKALGAWTNMCSCFEPRHAMRVNRGGHIYDYVLCYLCFEMRVYKDGEPFLSLKGDMGSDPAILNALLANNNVPLPYIYTEQAKKIFEEEEARKALIDKETVEDTR